MYPSECAGLGSVFTPMYMYNYPLHLLRTLQEAVGPGGKTRKIISGKKYIFLCRLSFRQVDNVPLKAGNPSTVELYLIWVIWPTNKTRDGRIETWGERGYSLSQDAMEAGAAEERQSSPEEPKPGAGGPGFKHGPAIPSAHFSRILPLVTSMQNFIEIGGKL